MDTNNNPDMERKLQAAVYMRESAQIARERLRRVGDILEGSHGAAPGYSYSGENTDEQNKTGLTFAQSIACRSGLVLLFLFFFFAGKGAPDGKIDELREECVKGIAVDYSENIFDFIQEIPYTFDYEKTNAEGRDSVKN